MNPFSSMNDNFLSNLFLFLGGAASAELIRRALLFWKKRESKKTHHNIFKEVTHTHIFHFLLSQLDTFFPCRWSSFLTKPLLARNSLNRWRDVQGPSAASVTLPQSSSNFKLMLQQSSSVIYKYFFTGSCWI